MERELGSSILDISTELNLLLTCIFTLNVLGNIFSTYLWSSTVILNRPLLQIMAMVTVK